MQFTTATIALVASMLSSTTLASPLALRAQMCGSTPSASGSQTPLSRPTAATAQACEQLCAADGSCQSFVFGLPPDASAPTCMLFSCAASQVPAQGTNLDVYDKACSNIPTNAPTSANPQGATGSANGGSGQQQGGRHPKRNVCGAAPTGPSTNSPSPMKTDQSIASQQACLALCQATSGCKSCEFGKPSANGHEECLLFQVAASQLPPPGNGQTFVAFDSGC